MIALIFSLLVWTNDSQAYPEIIRLKYSQCQACHTNSVGGGLLNPYGKSIRAGLPLFKRKDEQKNLENGAELDLNANAFVRYLWIESKSYKKQFLMQADVSGRYQSQSRAELPTFQATLGLVPTQVRSRVDAPKGVIGKSFLFRQFYLEKNFGENLKILVGRDFVPEGIKIEDHTAYMRTQNRRNVTDYVTQVRAEYATEKQISHLGFYGPSGEENQAAREWGGFVRTERSFLENLSLGVLGLYGSTDTISRSSGDLFAKYGFNSQTGVLGNFQYVRRHLSASNTDFNQYTGFLEPFYLPHESVILRYRWERFVLEAPFASRRERHSLSMDFKPVTEMTWIGTYRRETNMGRWAETQYLIQFYGQL